MQSLGIKENGPKVTYLIFRRGSTRESFFFHGLLDFVLFLILAWRTRVPHVSVFFCLQPGVEWLWFVCPLRTLLKNCLSYYLPPLRGRGPHFRFEVPANHLASLFSPLVSGNLRLLSTNIWSPLCDPHSFLTVTLDGLILSIQTREDSNFISLLSVGYRVTGSLTSLQRCHRCILQPQRTGLLNVMKKKIRSCIKFRLTKVNKKKKDVFENVEY